MEKIQNSRKAQLSIEAGFVLLFILVLLPTLWLSGPIQQSTEKSIDFNDIVLGKQLLTDVSEAVSLVGSGGRGRNYDFVVHVPFNAVHMSYGENGLLGPHINITVIVYHNLSEDSKQEFSRYAVDDAGNPHWMDAGYHITPLYYVNITQRLDHPITPFPFCDPGAKKDSITLRGQNTRLLDIDGNPIMICCEAGFNLHMFAQKSGSYVQLFQRGYYDVGEDWKL